MRCAGQILVYVLGFLLPWWAYIAMPQYGVFPLIFTMLGLVIVFIADWVRHGWRVPFELTLPLAVLSVISVFGFFQYFFVSPLELRSPLDPIYSLRVYMGPFVMLAVLHFARPRRVALNALNVLAFSAAAWAGLMLVAWLFRLFPATSLMGIARWRLPGLPFYAFIAMLFGAARNEIGSRRQLGFAAGAAIILVWLVTLGLPALDVPKPSISEWSLFLDEIGFMWPILLLNLLFYWPLARIAAKVEVVRRESPARPEPLFLLVLVGCAAVGVIRYTFNLQAETFIFALAGAWALPEREQKAAYGPDWRFAGVLTPICALIGFSLFNVNPANPVDPRNYAPPFAAGMMDPSFIDSYAAQLEAIEAAYPDEVQTNFWLGYRKLLHGNLYGAALEYRESLRPAKHLILPPPSDEERRAFMDELRDTASAMKPGEHHGAYELALAAEGRHEEALALMQGDAKIVPPPETAESSKPVFAAAVSAYLREPGLAEHFSDWTPGEVLALLLAWGGKTEPAAESVDPECLPAVLLFAPGLCESIRAEALPQEGATVRCLEGGGGLQVAGCEAAVPHKTVPARKDGAPAVVVVVEGTKGGR